MGLFDMFKGDQGEQMTPHLAFVTSLLYMMAADGEIGNEEIGHLLSVLGGESSGGTISVGANNKQMLDRAIKYARKHSVNDFFARNTPLLTDAQRCAFWSTCWTRCCPMALPRAKNWITLAVYASVWRQRRTL